MKDPVICDIVCLDCKGTDWNWGKDVHNLICLTEDCGHVIDSEGMENLLGNAYTMSMTDRVKEIFEQLKGEGFNLALLDCSYEGENEVWVAFAMDQSEAAVAEMKAILKTEDAILWPAIDLIEPIHELYSTLKAMFLLKDSVFKQGRVINQSNAEGVAKLAEVFQDIPVVVALQPGKDDYAIISWPKEHEQAGLEAMFEYMVFTGVRSEDQRKAYMENPDSYDSGSLVYIRKEDFEVECENLRKRDKGVGCA